MRIRRGRRRQIPLRTTSAHAGCWPDAGQAMLLRAAAGRGGPVIEAWERWIADNDVDRVDAASMRILPLLYRNLRGHGVEHPEMPRLKGMYRRSWYANQRLFAQGRSVLLAFQTENVDALVLKGAAHAVLDYRNIGVRQMSDLDVLVRPHQLGRALEALRALGWVPFAAKSQQRVDLLHADTCVNTAEGAADIDVHWRAMMHPVSDEELWEAAVPMELQGLPTRTLSAADRLLHTCVHGAATSNPRPVRWVADAAAVTRHGVDWDRLVDQARKRRATLTLSRTLDYVRSCVDAPVPVEVIAELGRGPHSRLESAAFEAAMSPLTVRGNLRRHWYRHRLVAGSAVGASLWFPTYLRLLLAFDRRRDFAWYVARRLVRGPSP